MLFRRWPIAHQLFILVLTAIVPLAGLLAFNIYLRARDAAALPPMDAYAVAWRSPAVSILVALAIAALVAGLCFGLARRIARPIMVIAEGAKRATAGDMGARVEAEGPAEIAEVAVQFNKMLAARAAADQERERADERIRDSEARFRTLFERAGIGIAMVDIEDGRILRCNPALAEMLGYRVEELARLTVKDVSETEDYERDRERWQQMVEGVGARFHMEKRYRRKDGSLMWGMLTSTMVRDVDARPLIIMGMLEDLTAMKLSQDQVSRLDRRLTMTMESITDAFFTLDVNWRFTYVNGEAERLLQRLRGDLLGKVIWEEFKEVVGTTFEREYRQAMRIMRTARFEERYLPLNLWVEIRAYPSDKGLAVYFLDVTRRKENEEQLRTLSDRLLSVQETERAALAHELHDEFGQVLTAVKLQLQAVEQRTPSPRIEDCVALVDQVLQQVRSLSLDLRPAQLDDQGLAVALASHLARLSRQTGRTIGFQCGDDVPRLVGQRATACFRIVQEAITNALRHSGAGEIRVKLERVGHDSHDDCAGASLRMVIRDDGVGFDPEVTRINALTGTSIGILGMQDRVNILGGALDIRSAPGTGTEVRVDIPLASLLQGSG